MGEDRLHKSDDLKIPVFYPKNCTKHRLQFLKTKNPIFYRLDFFSIVHSLSNFQGWPT